MDYILTKNLQKNNFDIEKSTTVQVQRGVRYLTCQSILVFVRNDPSSKEDTVTFSSEFIFPSYLTTKC